MDALRIGYESAGYRVRGVALAARAAAELDKSARIEQTSTIHTLLNQLEPWTDGRGQRHPARERLGAQDVIICDEAGMIDTPVMARLLEHAERSGARVVMVGDPRQLQAVGAGGVFRFLVEDARKRGQLPELSEVRRLQHQWSRDAAEQVRNGQVAEALATHNERGLLGISDDREQAILETVKRWQRRYDPSRPSDTLMITGTRDDAAALNLAAREHLKDRGYIYNEINFMSATGALNIGEGERVRFTRNAKFSDGERVRNGDTGTVLRTDFDRQGRAILTIRRDGEEQIIRVQQDEYNHLAHGYAGTAHAAQGATVEHAIVMSSGAKSLSKTYVELTRAREGTDIVLTRTTLDQIAETLEPTQAMRSYARDLAKSQGLDMTDEVLESFAQCRDWLNQYADKQLPVATGDWQQDVRELIRAMSDDHQKLTTLDFEPVGNEHLEQQIREAQTQTEQPQEPEPEPEPEPEYEYDQEPEYEPEPEPAPQQQRGRSR
jgi:ATP-dependent exoDNAse (exonuclease V) alpha subunit